MKVRDRRNRRKHWADTWPRSEKVVRECWDKTVAIAEGGDIGMCLCPRTSHGHDDPCEKTLYWSSRGSGKGSWEANHRRRPKHDGGGTAGNCEILCIACHQAVTNTQRARDPDW